MLLRLRNLFFGALLVGAIPLFAGCSSSGDDLPREPVTGTVTLDGVPLPTGSVTFIPTGGGATAGGAPISDGSFSIGREAGLVPGNYGVAIYSADKAAGQERPKQVGGMKEFKMAKEKILAKYNAQTELKAEIKKGGGNSLKFDLLSK